MTPSQRSTIIFVASLCVILGIFCIALILLVGMLMSPEGRATLVAPRPTDTSVPTPDPLSYEYVRSHYDLLSTDLQRRQYLDSLIGKNVHWRGSVTNVDGEGNVYIRVGNQLLWNASDVIKLQGVPLDRAAKFSSGAPIEFEATIKTADMFVGVQFDLKLILLIEPPTKSV